MALDLQHVLSYSKDSLQSRAQMRAIMQDLYPGKILEINTLLDVYESGVPREIRNTGKINDIQYKKYMQKILNDYGLQQRYAIDALNAWIDVCILPGTSSGLRLAGGQQYKPIVQPITNPINHVPINTGQVVINGNTRNYETKNIGSNQVIITKFIGFDIAETIVPNEIDGKRVVEVGENAFYNTGIKSLDIPNGIKTISAFAFYNCKNLMKVILPDSLRAIEIYAFQRCSALASISLASGVIEIKGNAFEECTSLTKVGLNEELQSIGEEAFKKCISLKSIVIPRSVTAFGDGIFSNRYSFDKLDIEVLCYQGSKAVEYARNNNLKVINANMTS